MPPCQGRAARLFRRFLVCGPISIDAGFNLAAEMADEPLYRPGCRIAERANGVPLDPGGHIIEQIDLVLLGLAPLHALQHAPHPASPLPAGSALAAALVLVDVGDAPDSCDDVGGFVDDDHGRLDRTRLEIG